MFGSLLRLRVARWRAVLGSALTLAAALVHPGSAIAAGGNYVFEGGTAYEQQQVREALNASSFNWSLVTEQITIDIAPIADDEAIPGEIFLDPDLLNSGEFSWRVVQNEYANEIDFYLLSEQDHATVNTALGGTCGAMQMNPGSSSPSTAASGSPRRSHGRTGSRPRTASSPPRSRMLFRLPCHPLHSVG